METWVIDSEGVRSEARAMNAETLDVRVRVAPALVGSGARAAVVFRRWGGAAVSELVGATVLDRPELTLTVKPPGEGPRTTLPAELGGPFPFAIGYLVALGRPEVEGAEAPVLARSPDLRVVWLSGRFPLDGLRAAAASSPYSPAELEDLFGRLEALQPGLSLARVTLTSRSMMGFGPANDEVVTLEPIGGGGVGVAWPPAAF